ncbi:hypothetical protein ADL02_14105 [Streptomyces sp. NRRL WC-3723]|nr:hypothetical protein ADL02_14105 [Streptomyces sp. NRRL WC-3723]
MEQLEERGHTVSYDDLGIYVPVSTEPVVRPVDTGIRPGTGAGAEVVLDGGRAPWSDVGPAR